MCGDEYPVELILGPLLHHQSCYCNSDRPDTVMLETYVGTTKKTVSITLSSYHSKFFDRHLYLLYGLATDDSLPATIWYFISSGQGFLM